MRFKCDMQPQIRTQEMHELPQTERQIERERDGKSKGAKDISILDNTRMQTEQTKCWSNLFLLKCQLMLSAFCGFSHSPPHRRPSYITHAGPWLGCFGLAPHVLVDDFCYMFFSWYSTVVSSSSFFGIKLNSREISLRVADVCVCALHTHFCYYFMAHDEKNRNLLAVNFTHSPRSLRQSLVFFLLPLLLLFFVFLLSK